MALTATSLPTFFTNANAGTAPSAAQTAALTALYNQYATGTLTEAQATASAIDLASDTTTAVSVETYSFFTGVAPSQAGLAFLNQAFVGTGVQASLNGENRFIAQSVALALGNAAAKTKFTTDYGSLSIADATKNAYDIIIGNSAAAAAGINVANSVAFLTSAASIAYYTAYVKANTPAGISAADLDLAVKAAIVGEIMYIATTYNNGAGLGSYATATTNLIKDLADDGILTANNANGINLFTSYGSGNVGTGTPGSTLALTINTDAITGTANDDTINAVITGVAGAGATTLNFGDVVNGGAGNDTLVLLSNTTTGYTVSGLQLTSVETIAVNNTLAGGGADSVTVDMSGVSGVTSVVSTGVGDVIVTNIGTGTSVGFKGVSLTGTAAATVTAAGARSVTLTGLSTASTASSTVNVSGAAAVVGSSLAIVNTGAAATLTTLTYGSTGAATTKTISVNAGGNITIGTLASAVANELTTLNVSGSGAFKVTTALNSNVLAKVDASTNTGGVNLTLNATALTSLKGSTAADTITLTTAGLGATAVVDLGAGDDKLVLNAAVTSGAKITGGDGTDTLAISSSTTLDATTKAAISSFETVELSGAAQTYDTTLLTGFANLNVSGGTVALTNLGASATVNITGTVTTLSTALASAAGTTDVINLNVGVAATTAGAISGLTATGIETININSINGTAAGASSPASNTVVLTSDVDLAKINVTGAGLLSLDVHASTHALSIDASANTAGVTVLGSVGAGAGNNTATTLNFIGTNANDTFTASATATSGGLINTGKGGDLITLGGGVDTVILKAGDSSLDLTAGVAAGVGGKSAMDVISGFAIGSDKIDLTQIAGFGTTGQGVASATVGAGADAALNALLATTGVFKDGGGLQRGVLDITGYAANTHFVVVDVNHDGNYTAGTDLVIQLTGTAGALTATDFNFGS